MGPKWSREFCAGDQRRARFGSLYTPLQAGNYLAAFLEEFTAMRAGCQFPFERRRADMLQSPVSTPL
jgi:hypothetical protein